MNAWKPLQYRSPVLGEPFLGQSSIAFKKPTSVTGIGGMLLLSGVLTNMLVSTDQRPVAQGVRVLVAGFAVYLVVDQSFSRQGSVAPSLISVGAPALGLAAVVAALTGAGYLIFRKKSQ